MWSATPVTETPIVHPSLKKLASPGNRHCIHLIEHSGAPHASRPPRRLRSRGLPSWTGNGQLASSRSSTPPARFGRATDSSSIGVPIGDAIRRIRRCTPCVRARVCVSVTQSSSAQHCGTAVLTTLTPSATTSAQWLAAPSQPPHCSRNLHGRVTPSLLVSTGLEPATSLLSYRCYGLQTTPRP